MSQGVTQATGGLSGAVNSVGGTVNGVTDGVGGVVKASPVGSTTRSTASLAG